MKNLHNIEKIFCKILREMYEKYIIRKTNSKLVNNSQTE